MTALTTASTEELGLRSGVFSTVDADGELRLLLYNSGESFGQASPWKHAVLRRLAEGRCPAAELAGLARVHGVPDTDVAALLDRLRHGGWLTTSVLHRDRPLYTIRWLRRSGAPPSTTRTALVLSRFALLHREADQIVVESPLAWGELLIHDPDAMLLVGALGRPVSPGTAVGLLSAEVTERMLRDLQAAGLAVPVPSAEDTELRLLQWRPHELWLHERSRIGTRSYFGEGYGRSLWARGRFDPLPARHPPYPGPAVDLFLPDLETLRRDDPPLTAVVEERRSERVHDDDHPITVQQLGELLYRCARNRDCSTTDGVEYLDRPHPSGGAAYELELYPVVRRVAGLEQGMYHYDPHDHRLALVRQPSPEVGKLLATATRSTFQRQPPQVLIVIAARFGRLMWAYEQIPYSLVLKHVGVLYQTMYLVATSMGLAACALGGGDAMAFNEATGLDYATESSVGEFLLGSRAT
jgi:SagB-type dehydrogenase family enzyme